LLPFSGIPVTAVFILAAGAGDFLSALALVHIPCLAASEILVLFVWPDGMLPGFIEGAKRVW